MICCLSFSKTSFGASVVTVLHPEMRALGSKLYTSGENGLLWKNAVFNHLVGGMIEMGEGFGH